MRSILILAAMLAAPAPTAATPPGRSVAAAGGNPRQEHAGVSMPRTLAGLKRRAIDNGQPSLIAIYAADGEPDPSKHSVTIAVGPAAGLPSQEEMRSSVRAAVSDGKTVNAIAEGAFKWPGHPEARTFRGRYSGQNSDKEIWTTGDGRVGVLVMIAVPAGNSAEMERLSAAVARDVFGGVKLPAAAAKSGD